MTAPMATDVPQLRPALHCRRVRKKGCWWRTSGSATETDQTERGRALQLPPAGQPRGFPFGRCSAATTPLALQTNGQLLQDFTFTAKDSLATRSPLQTPTSCLKAKLYAVTFTPPEPSPVQSARFVNSGPAKLQVSMELSL